MSNAECLRILFIGDIVGSIGRAAVAKLLPELRKEYSPDLVIANGENAAHGKGITILTAKELFACGIDYITTGDHCFDQTANIEGCFNGDLPILRPANYGPEAPGRGYAVIPTAKGEVLLMNLIGRTFMSRHYECPFRKASEILGLFTDKKFSAIIADIHAEATSEKIALRHFLNGKVSALFGTHTHVQTADELITPAGTAYLTDAGMTGLANGVIGIAAEPIVASFLTQIKQPHQLPAVGPAFLNAVAIEIDPATGQCLKLERIQRHITIDERT